MATYTLNTRLQQKSDSAANWTSNSTKVLLRGEQGIEIDTGKFKIGDGISTWAELAYYEMFTTDEKSKLSGIEATAEVNQNAFSGLSDGTNTASADSKTDSVLITGSNGIAVTVSDTAGDATVTIDGTHDHDAQYLALSGGTLT